MTSESLIDAAVRLALRQVSDDWPQWQIASLAEAGRIPWILHKRAKSNYAMMARNAADAERALRCRRVADAA